ncbi:MAG: phosphomannomutase/phosphoglucomutase [candidate division WOR-3 bacterium]
MINKDIFREYDIRGIADRDLTDEIVYRIGQGYGTYLLMRRVEWGIENLSEVLIGRDVRLSSERIRNALIAGITSTGLDVIDLGIIPTPVFYFSLFHYDKNAGMQITGSHNEKEYNGFKIGFGKTTIYGEEIQKLRRLVEEGKFKQGKGKVYFRNPIPDYIGTLKERIKFKNSLKVVFDPGNGTVGILLEELLRDYPIEPAFINLEPDGNFPVHLPDPTVDKYMNDLKSLVSELDADLGIGYDGDGDRIGAVAEDGEIIRGDKLLGIFARDLIKRVPKAKVVFDVKCSKGLKEYIIQIGGVPIMWKTGHSLVKAKMKEEGALLAGEMSGHMFFGENYFGYDDALYASLKLLQIVSETGKGLRELASEIPHYISTPEIRIECPEAEKFEIVAEAKAYFFKKLAGRKCEIIDIDGVRVEWEDGFGLLRASNTQPILVLRFEGKTEKRLEEIREIFLSFLSKYSYIKIPAS